MEIKCESCGKSMEPSQALTFFSDDEPDFVPYESVERPIGCYCRGCAKEAFDFAEGFLEENQNKEAKSCQAK